MVALPIVARAAWVRVPGLTVSFYEYEESSKVGNKSHDNFAIEARAIVNIITCGKAQQVNGS